VLAEDYIALTLAQDPKEPPIRWTEGYLPYTFSYLFDWF
jgi:hypothetical protein